MTPSPGISGLLGATLGLAGAFLAVFLLRWSASSIWGPLCVRFSPAGPDPADEKRFQSFALRVNALLYLKFNFSAALRVSEIGIRIRPQGPAGLLFAAVELPWSAIDSVEFPRSLLGISSARVRVRGYAPVLLFFFGAAADIREQWARRAP